MARRKTQTARQFLVWYNHTDSERQKAASEVLEWLRGRLYALDVRIDSITTRAKDLASLKGKLRLKKYISPKKQCTDTIGARVVVLFESEVVRVVRYLEQAVKINELHSRRAGSDFGIGEFGYRSVHLVCRFPSRSLQSYVQIGQPWVEIQIRSLLQHAWAVAGHDYLYKSAVEMPAFMKRRFYAIAGGLELYDQEFNAVRSGRRESHDRWVEDLLNGRRWSDKADICGVSATMSVAFPSAIWGTVGRPDEVDVAIETAIMAILGRCRMNTPNALKRATETRSFRSKLRAFASECGVSPEHVSNYAKTILAISIRFRHKLLREYDELVADPALKQAVNL